MKDEKPVYSILNKPYFFLTHFTHNTMFSRTILPFFRNMQRQNIPFVLKPLDVESYKMRQLHFFCLDLQNHGTFLRSNEILALHNVRTKTNGGMLQRLIKTRMNANKKKKCKNELRACYGNVKKSKKHSYYFHKKVIIICKYAYYNI